MIPDREIPKFPHVLHETIQYVMEMTETERRQMLILMAPTTTFVDHLASLPDTEEPVHTALIRLRDAQNRLVVELSSPSPNPIVVYGLRYGLLQAVTFLEALKDVDDTMYEEKRP